MTMLWMILRPILDAVMEDKHEQWQPVKQLMVRDSATGESQSWKWNEEMLEEASLSQFPAIVKFPPDEPESYSLEEINDFHDETYSTQILVITDSSPNVDRFINSVMKSRKIAWKWPAEQTEEVLFKEDSNSIQRKFKIWG